MQPFDSLWIDRSTHRSVHLVKIGMRHPDPVVETSSLSSVNPPNVWYRLSIPEETIDHGWLSALQLEAITYAAQVNTIALPAWEG